MADPAIQSAIDAVLAAVEAIVPTVEASQRFRRISETAPYTTRGGMRLFDVEFRALRDDSNDGRGVQTAGKADRTTTAAIRIEYPLARAKKALETTIAVDAELVLRALGRSANWAGTVVARVSASASVDRSEASVLTEQGPTPGTLYLVVTCVIQYRDTES